MILLWAILSAHAKDVKFNGDVKNFFISAFPYESDFLPTDPSAQAFLDGRLKLKAKLHRNLRFTAHHAVTMGSQNSTAGNSSVFATGVGLTAPEVVELSWKAYEDSELMMQGRTDRLLMELSIDNTEIRLGRQPISFGYGTVFNPLDLIQPFSVATIDSEYKPGVDALRADLFFGMSTQVTLATAYLGDWESDGMVFAANGKSTFGSTEISLFSAFNQGDWVFATGASGSIGPVGVYGDFAFTLPEEDETDPFVRSDIGALWKPFASTTISADVYIQTLGAEDAASYMQFAQQNSRYQRGELWLMGRYYGSLGLNQQLTPLLSCNFSSIVNLSDNSTMLNGGLSYSMADNVAFSAAVIHGIGERPEILGIQSEFGVYPTIFFSQMRAYF